MANKVYSDFADVSPLDGNEIIPCIDDPSGTPANGRFTPADLATYLGTGTSITGMVLTWDAVDGITVGTGQCYTEGGDNISASSAIAKTSLSLSTSTWYHVYVYLSGGSPAAEVVTTAPAAWTGTAYSKTGDTSRRYVGSVLTDGSGNIIPFEHYANKIIYKLYQVNGAPHNVLAAGTSTTAVALDLTGVVPATSRLAIVQINNSSDKTAYTSENSSVATGQKTGFARAGAVIVIEHAMDASQQIFYAISSAVGSGSLEVNVMGYIFDR